MWRAGFPHVLLLRVTGHPRYPMGRREPVEVVNGDPHEPSKTDVWELAGPDRPADCGLGDGQMCGRLRHREVSRWSLVCHGVALPEREGQRRAMRLQRSPERAQPIPALAATSCEGRGVLEHGQRAARRRQVDLVDALDAWVARSATAR